MLWGVTGHEQQAKNALANITALSWLGRPSLQWGRGRGCLWGGREEGLSKGQGTASGSAAGAGRSISGLVNCKGYPWALLWDGLRPNVNQLLIHRGQPASRKTSKMIKGRVYSVSRALPKETPWDSGVQSWLSSSSNPQL